ncbi:sensor histidine kinase [Mucilaginibacter sp.]|uniref:sensor histidine kinase n=1 Tax=Mucilaginibacter sp. TaxID=1882438 RepID=UPI002611AD6C|nr:sensor histidine kinase [Mucilaginibacter sp.]
MSEELYRLNAVSRFKQPDAAVTTDLNEIVNLATQICDMPVALITLLDEDTQWFKASKGVDIDCTAREVSLCNHTILQNNLLIVNDTRLDERFNNNPLVIGEPFVCFYAGATLTTTDGYAIGSLCVIDFEPRELTELQQNSLKVLSKQVMNLMELNHTLNNMQRQQEHSQKQNTLIEESELKLNAIFNSTKDTHILVNSKLEVMAFNRASTAFVRNAYGKTIKPGISVLEYADREAVETFANYFKNAFAGKTIKVEWHMRPGTKFDSWKELEFIPVKNSAKKVIGVALNSTDITERKLQEAQINIQNAALTRIAIIQSHELRRPVASLLGIMALIKMEQNSSPDYFDMMEVTVKELDLKIREIVKDSETTINNHLAIVA